jgi:hypothetical protein
VVFPKILEKYTYLLSTDTPITAIGELSIVEDSAPKLLVSAIEILQETVPEGTQPLKKSVYQKRQIPDSITEAKARSENAASLPVQPVRAQTPAKPKTLYLKVSDMQSEECRRVCSLLESLEGQTPVVFFDASTKKYVKAVGRSTEILPNMFRLLQMLLGEDSVIYK